MNNFLTLYEAGVVERFHTVRTHRRQTIADHSWGVAMVVLMIYPECPRYVLEAALFHDLAESVTGDLPATVKWKNPVLQELLAEMEHRFNKEHKLTSEFMTAKDHDVLKWADMMELVLFCRTEVEMGNLPLTAVLRRGQQHLKTLGFPTKQAEHLYEDILGE